MRDRNFTPEIAGAHDAGPIAAKRAAQRGNASGVVMAIFVFIIIVAAGVWAVYTYGEGHIQINGRGVDELELWEVIGGVIAGIIGLFVGLIFGAVGLLIGLVALVLSLALAVAGVAAGLFISIGTMLGPFLLLAAIILLMRRQGEGGQSQASRALLD